MIAPIQTLVAEIGSMFGSGEERPATIMGTIGVQLATPTRRGLLNRSGFPLLLFVFLMAVASWAICVQDSYGFSVPQNGTCSPYSTGVFSAECSSAYESCPQSGFIGGAYRTGLRAFNEDNSCSSSFCGSPSIKLTSVTCSYDLLCSSQCEADSLVCVNSGKEWTTISSGTCGGKGCKECPNDTTWQEISCAYSPQRGQYLNVVNIYGIHNCESYSRSQQYYSPQCDSTGADSTYTCIGTIDGENVYMRTPWGATFSCAADGSCARAQQMIAAGECKAPRPQSSSSTDLSSSSEGESSSSEGNPEDTSGVATHVIVDELPQRLYDSLGAIDYNIELMQPMVVGIYNGVYEMIGNQYEMKQNQRQGLDLLGDIRDATEGANTKLSTTNNLLNDIKNKNWSPNINVQPPQVNVENNTDVSGIQSRQDQTRDTLHNTNSLLEQIKGLLGSSGSDTIHVDTSKAPASIDSALKFWGNRNNRNFGTAGLDTSGWGNTNDSASVATDSALSQGTWTKAMGCDTTGGRKCDGAIIGIHGLDSAKSGMVNAYHGLGDTLRNGAFGDSLRQWGDKFTGGVISGSGSQNCPSVLTRSYRVNIIGETGYDFTLGNYLCSPIFGSVTAWALCRLLLRASVALACMWFLFKCATGFKGQGEDD